MTDELETRPTQSDCSIVETYTGTEYPINVIENDVFKTVYVRVLIMTRDIALNGVSIVLTSDNRIFITNNIQSGQLFLSEQLNMYDIKNIKQKIKEYDEKLSKMNIILEELQQKSQGHTLINTCEYVVFKTYELSKFVGSDFERCYNIENQRWYYYSEALNSWTMLPINWQKLTKIVRYVADLSNLNTEHGITVGCLENNTVYQVTHGEMVEIARPEHEIGDEYKVPGKGYIVYTQSGWKFIEAGG